MSSMNTRRRRDIINRTITAVRAVTKVAALETRTAELVGPAGNSSNDPTGHPTPASRPPADPDPARMYEHLDRFDQLISEACQRLEQAAHIIDTQTRRPSPEDFEDLSTSWAPDACTPHRDMLKRHETAHTKQPTTAGGRLTRPVMLCKACYDRVGQTGKLPTRDDINAFERTGRWPSSRINPKEHR